MSLISKEVIKNIRRIQIRTGKTVNDVLAGAYHSVFKGRGMIFEDVREYQPGDDVRSIDWNVTARMNYPYVKNFREERELTVFLLIDVSSSSLFGVTGKQKNELIAEIGAVLAFSAITNNDKVGLVLFSDIIEKYLPPKKGLRHVLRVIRELLVFQPKHLKTDINSVLNFLGKVQKRSGVCFIISDFITLASPKELAFIAKRHDLTSIVITDPRERYIPNVGLIKLKDLETGENIFVDTSIPQVRDELRNNTQNRIDYHKNLMKKIGAGFIHVQTEVPYVRSIEEYFAFRGRKR